MFITSNRCFGDPFFCRGVFFPNQFLYYPPLFWPETQYEQQPYPVVQQTYDDTALRSQIDRLTEEVAELRQERAPQPSSRSPLEQTPTVLVFRDGHRSEVQNYGIVGQTLWVFTERHQWAVAGTHWLEVDTFRGTSAGLNTSHPPTVFSPIGVRR